MWEDANVHTSSEPKNACLQTFSESVIQHLGLISDNDKVKKYPTLY